MEDKQEIQNLTAIPTLSPRLDPVRESPGSLSPLLPLSSYCQKNLPPTSHFRFTRQTTRFPHSTGSVPTGFSAPVYYSGAPEPQPNSPDDFTHVEDPNSNVKSLRESSVGVDDGREDDGEGLGRRRTLPEELSSTVVVFTCMSKDGTCDVFLLRQGLCKEEVPIISCSKTEEPYLRLWDLDVDMFKSLMWNSKAVVNKLEVCRGNELRVAFEEARKYGGKVANKLEGYPGCEFGVAEDDCAPRDITLKMSLQERTKLLVSRFYAVDDKDDEDDLVLRFESFDQEMSEESPTLMKTVDHERD